MPDRVSISHRGARYELGRGQDFYGIWSLDGALPASLERWPKSQEGWYRAWARFTTLEPPGAIVALDAPPERDATARPPFVSVGLLLAGVGLGIASLFPSYLSGASLAQQAPELLPHVVYLATWILSAALLCRRGPLARAGALIGFGLSVTTFGFYFADAGSVIAYGAHIGGTGLYLGLAGWVLCALGSGAAAVAAGLHRSLARPQLRRLPPYGAIAAVIAAIGTAIAFAPSWDSYFLQVTSGATESLTAGNAFANPAPVIAGNVAVMVALVAVAACAALWRPAVLGASLLAGAAIAMVAQAVSALVQLGEAVSPTLFNISPAQAAESGLQIAPGLTAAFYVYCIFLVALVVLCGQALVTPRPRPSLATSRR